MNGRRVTEKQKRQLQALQKQAREAGRKVPVCRYTGKQSFVTEQQAMNQVARARTKRYESWTVKRYYRCPMCQMWHLTSKDYTDTNKSQNSTDT